MKYVFLLIYMPGSYLRDAKGVAKINVGELFYKALIDTKRKDEVAV